MGLLFVFGNQIWCFAEVKFKHYRACVCLLKIFDGLQRVILLDLIYKIDNEPIGHTVSEIERLRSALFLTKGASELAEIAESGSVVIRQRKEDADKILTAYQGLPKCFG